MPAIPKTKPAERLLDLARELSRTVDKLNFEPPVTHVYNPLAYAWKPYATYVRRFGNSPKRVVFLGMNPGPFGMAQTGIPFGEIKAVRDWMQIQEPVSKPRPAHPRRPVEGFSCQRSEVSGQRLWGLFAQRFGPPEAFFSDHFVLNYCPLCFMEESGRNRTPDQLAAEQARPLFAACDAHLRGAIKTLSPVWAIGIGGFAVQCLTRVLAGNDTHIGQILHPSPANPAANRGWAERAAQELIRLGVWH